ncbi:D-TA family PLP-dependent enzyme [Frigidibacter sp. ROC022]|uniref:D-TA family PLP-dependent enzyme n=1 Tax=Frigidibacter sp. ROC022 TaxID=2971796 RepID=UPI00215A9EC3|nr:D-TA family PLP-dependent enzyme [Frigidibacter sp. ROC022]MCR8722712.1 D-TA family PLP-dependent enzyme [Frigidibacter sp. ROC022]
MHIDEIDTPAVLIDMDRVEANLARAQAYADANGLPLRPHVKTHKLPEMALKQVALGAVGITCQKLGEAEAMADGGLTDIFLPYNILGAAKLDRLAALNDRVTLAVTADSAETVAGYAARFGKDAPLKVLVECDTGAGRCGVQTAGQAVALARQIAAAPGLIFGGLMTYPPKGGVARADAWLKEAKTALEAAGLPPETISSGGTPDLMKAAEGSVTTEYRPGTYIYSDRMQVALGHGTLDDCALTVKATVVSRPTGDRAVLDTGSKALAADPAPAPMRGHGHIVEYPDAIVQALSEEHAVVDLSACDARPRVGETVRVIPNHACVVTNLHDRVYLIRGDQVEREARITSRGKLQ